MCGTADVCRWTDCQGHRQLRGRISCWIPARVMVSKTERDGRRIEREETATLRVKKKCARRTIEIWWALNDSLAIMRRKGVRGCVGADIKARTQSWRRGLPCVLSRSSLRDLSCNVVPLISVTSTEYKDGETMTKIRAVRAWERNGCLKLKRLLNWKSLIKISLSLVCKDQRSVPC